jgi:Xaa-Pro dipeptidase
MAIHFSPQELRLRRDATTAELAARGLAGLLIFRQESMYYLTGYDTFGYCFFQCLFLGTDGRMTLLTRAPDLRQARHTSVIDDVRVWVDGPEADPAQELIDILAEHDCRDRTLGMEFDSYGLTAHNWRRIETALASFYTLRDASDVVSRLRAVKSPAEIAYIQRAAELADDALARAIALTRPGAFEGEILAAMQSAVFAGGGDYPGNDFIIGSGRDALLCRYFSGRRRLADNDQLTLEFAGVYRRYHACLMRTFLIGKPHPAHLAMYEACRDALENCRQALRPGRPLGDVFDVHARTLDAAGYRAHRLNACGYSLGATYAPTWMDWPMLYAGNPTPAQPDMVFFIHIILMDSDADRAMSLGQTVRVTETGCEALSKAPLEIAMT